MLMIVFCSLANTHCSGRPAKCQNVNNNKKIVLTHIFFISIIIMYQEHRIRAQLGSMGGYSLCHQSPLSLTNIYGYRARQKWMRPLSAQEAEEEEEEEDEAVCFPLAHHFSASRV
jgi:hypothetical protein